MSGFIAALPMYDWPEARAETDAEWSLLSATLRRRGIDPPVSLVRCNADMPAVPEGIRAGGRVIAPDPSTLPPGRLDLPTLWRHPALLLAQTCWGPMELGLAEHVRVVGQPDYSAFEGGEGPFYSSAIVMRRGDAGMARDVPAPADGSALIPLERMTGARLAYNSIDSMSGLIALTRDLEQFQQKCAAVLRPELRKNKEMEHFRDSEKNGNARKQFQQKCAAVLRPELRKNKEMEHPRDPGENGNALEGCHSLTGLFSAVAETGGHRASIVAVAEGRADVCAVDCRSWAMAKRYESLSGRLSVVGWTRRRKGLPYISSLDCPAYRLD